MSRSITKVRPDRRAGFPACQFTGLSSPVFLFYGTSGRNNNTALESAANRQAGKPALQALAPRPGGGSRGFTLIEFIGVLAVLAILAALVAPAAIRQIDEAARTKESTDLVAISDAVVHYILTAKSIPHETNLAGAVAAWTHLPVSRIATNPRGQTRAFIIDTSGWFGTTALPYNQTTAGTTNMTTTARLMIVSSVGRALPVNTGRPGDAEFNAIWNTADGAIPSTWGGWQGRGEDLFIQRMNLQQHFHRLIVVNRDANALPRMSIGTNSAITIANAVDAPIRYYLDGSDVRLYNASNTPPAKRFTLTKDTGFVFEGVWRDSFGGGGESNEQIAQAFAELATRFLSAEWYPNATQGGRTGTQQGALTAMYNFMLVYGLWADPFPHFNKHGANANQVPEYELLIDIVGTGSGVNAGGRLNQFTGPNGLLN